jgi:SAM-dependent methyltransferase
MENVGATATQAQSPTIVRVQDAVNFVRDRFPFPGYVDANERSCVSIAESIMRHLPPSQGAKILDLGCGPCEKTAILSALGYKCSGYDDLQDDWHKIPENRRAILNFAAEMGVDFRLADGNPFPWAPQTFDLVMANDVIEHLHNSPRNLLNSLVSLLKEEGFLLITVPNAVNIRKRVEVALGRTNYQKFNLYYWYPDPWRGHIREYTKGDLHSLAENLGFSIVELQSRDHMLRRIPAPLRAPYLALTGIFRGWKDSWLLIARKEKGWKPREMSRAELSSMFTEFGAGAYPSDAAAKESR